MQFASKLFFDRFNSKLTGNYSVDEIRVVNETSGVKKSHVQEFFFRKS